MFTGSCSSTMAISTRVIEPNPATIQRQLHKGDLVTVYTRDNRNFELKIIEVNPDAITGTRFDKKRGQQVLPLNEILRIEKIPSRNPVSSNTANEVKSAVILALVVIAGIFVAWVASTGLDFGLGGD